MRDEPATIKFDEADARTITPAKTMLPGTIQKASVKSLSNFWKRERTFCFLGVCSRRVGVSDPTRQPVGP